MLRPLLILSLLVFLSLPAHADQLQDGKSAFDRHDYQTAMKILQPLAERGNTTAQINLAFILMFHAGLEKKEGITEGLKWLGKAADRGNPEAQQLLGWTESLIAMKENQPAKFAEAEKRYQQAADNGNVDAQYLIAAQYENGAFGGIIKKDYAEAVKWYRKAAEQENAGAQASLADIYFRGRSGIPKDYGEAYFWYSLAAANGWYRDIPGPDYSKLLTPEQRASIEKRSQEWEKNHPAPAAASQCWFSKE